ncbi:MAG: hypothetical protein Fur0021_23060 [Candidatus Promineifilaceae bacterium]
MAVGIWVAGGDAGTGIDASAARVGMAGIADEQATSVVNAMITGSQMSRESGFARFKSGVRRRDLPGRRTGGFVL